MVKIRELYYEDAYMRDFEASVVSCSADDKGRINVVLDKTAFFPEEGGQSCDKGYLETGSGERIEVLYVGIMDGIVTHRVLSPLKEGEQITGHIDWEHRFSNMQQHTGEHIFSGIVNSRFGYDNVGFHLSDNEVTMDYNGVLTRDDIAGIEDAVNRAIWDNLEVFCEFPSDEVLKDLEYRSKKELMGDVRIVTIPGIDVCACCAPHVKRTGEIGLLKVVSLQNYKGGVRVSILCGKRALSYFGSQQEIIRLLTDRMTTSQDRIVDSVDRLGAENKELKQKNSELNDRLIEIEIAQTDKSMRDVFLVKDSSFTGNNMKKTVNSLAEIIRGYCGVFAGSEGEGYRYMIASGKEKEDVSDLQKILTMLGARGGGSKVMIQGSITGTDAETIIGRLKRQ